MKFAKKLKKIDIFGTPVPTFLTYRDKNGNKSFSENHGSNLGGLLTIICVMVTLGYLSYLYGNMMSGQADSINKVDVTNDFTGEHSSIYMNQTSFLPYLKID